MGRTKAKWKFEYWRTPSGKRKVHVKRDSKGRIKDRMAV